MTKLLAKNRPAEKAARHIAVRARLARLEKVKLTSMLRKTA